MLEFCDEVRVCTRPEWVPIIQNMEMNVKLIVKEPSTMSDAIQYMVGEHTDTVVVGMPDTFILNSNSNIYKELMKEEKELLPKILESALTLKIWLKDKGASQ